MRSEVSAARMLEALVCGVLESGDFTAIDGSMGEQIGPLCDPDNLIPPSPEDLLHDWGRAKAPAAALDFGCGVGAHRGMIERFGFTWNGVTYRNGMAEPVRATAAGNPDVQFYDGLILPFPDQAFDAVWSLQVFEHIQHIETTFSEVRRVLKPGGRLIGSVSYLEQMHDYSTFNFTPYGFKLACERAGLRVLRLYPRFDIFSWMMRRLLVATSGSDETSVNGMMRNDGPIAQSFNAHAERSGLPIRDRNLLRLMFSAQFTFAVERPA